MNIIEQLGGYDSLKKEYEETLPLIQKGYKSKSMEIIRLLLLEYRRQHNIFESEDKIVVKNDCLIDFADLTLNLKVLTVLMMTDEGFIRSIEAAGLFKSSLVRHATPEEIKAGRRLP